jgi:DNA-binding IclR family transcriptional regulator
LKEKTTKSNQSITKAFKIIEEMAKSSGPMKLNEIAAGTGFPNSTVLRMLGSLMACGYVVQNEKSLKYSLSIKFNLLGEQVKSQMKIRDIAKPYLNKLSQQYKETACLSVSENNAVIYLDAVEGNNSTIRTLPKIGSTAPMNNTGSGKLLMLNFDDEQLEQYVNTVGLVKTTENTFSTLDSLKAELSKIRAQGYALDDEENEIGIRCLAAPIRDYTGFVIACISISAPTTRLTLEKINNEKKYILNAVAEISKNLGYDQ